MLSINNYSILEIHQIQNSLTIINYYILVIQYMHNVTDIFSANRFEIHTLCSLIT